MSDARSFEKGHLGSVRSLPQFAAQGAAQQGSQLGSRRGIQSHMLWLLMESRGVGLVRRNKETAWGWEKRLEANGARGFSSSVR